MPPIDQSTSSLVVVSVGFLFCFCFVGCFVVVVVFWGGGFRETETENDSAIIQFFGLATRAEMWTLRTPSKVPE